MDTSDFEACVALHGAEIAAFKPDVVVGSSFGGAVAMALIQRARWDGPTLLLAQAGLRYGLSPKLPSGISVLLVHATSDTLVPVADSRSVAAANETARLIEIDDDHALSAAVAAGQLMSWVELIAGDPTEQNSG